MESYFSFKKKRKSYQEKNTLKDMNLIKFTIANWEIPINGLGLIGKAVCCETSK